MNGHRDGGGGCRVRFWVLFLPVAAFAVWVAWQASVWFHWLLHRHGWPA